MDRHGRVLLAERLRSLASAVAEEVTQEFLEAHPDWVSRFGERARLRGLEDARYHVHFLAAALEAGPTDAFADYAQWTARVLAARGIASSFLAENLAQIERHLSQRLPSSESALLCGYVRVALEAVDHASVAGAGSPSGDALALTARMYLQAVLAGERTAALTIVLEAVREGRAAVDVYIDVLQAALYEVGRLWETNQITVAHEHAATAITQFVAAHLYDRIDRAVKTRGTLLITGLEGELHSVGAVMVADVLEANGWTVHFLGTNLPHASILDAIRQRKPDCIGISATMLFNVPAVRRLIDDIRGEWGRSKRVLLGGGAFRRAPELWRELGADGHARDLREAIGLMCQ